MEIWGDFIIPQISPIDIQNIEIQPQPSRTHRLTDKRIEGQVDGIQAVQQAVFHILSTERFAYQIYDDNYGVELEKYIGKSFEFVKAGIGLDITEALMQDDRITAVEINSITQSGLDSVLIDITVISTEGTFAERVTVNV